MASATHSAPTGRPALDGLGQQLREMFQEIIAGPMPQHLVDIVDQLEAQSLTAVAPAGGDQAVTPP
ncbi:MAG TPA: NepR family anti-sigma factor [Caulobacteraceae bacterium]|jgi:hypothetical protein